MKFVKGSPVQGFSDTYWYLHLVGNDAREFVCRLLRSNAIKFMTDPHAMKDYASHLAATASEQLADKVLLGERDGYYVNKGGGMTPELYAICDEQEAPNFPSVARLIVSRWPKGTHFYAKVDGFDVVNTRGRYKWDTQRGARRAAVAFAKKRGIVL